MKDVFCTVIACLLTAVLAEVGLSAQPDARTDSSDFASINVKAPSGTQITIDAQPRSSSGPVAVGPIKKGDLSKHELRARFTYGGELSKTLLLRAGLHYRISISDPRDSRPELVVQTGHSGGVSSVAFSPPTAGRSRQGARTMSPSFGTWRPASFCGISRNTLGMSSRSHSRRTASRFSPAPGMRRRFSGT